MKLFEPFPMLHSSLTIGYRQYSLGSLLLWRSSIIVFHSPTLGVARSDAVYCPNLIIMCIGRNSNTVVWKRFSCTKEKKYICINISMTNQRTLTIKLGLMNIQQLAK